MLPDARPRLLADENLNALIVRQLLSRLPELKVVSVTIHALAGPADSVILEYATAEDLILVSHDLRTLPPLLRDRLAVSDSFPGVILVGQTIPVGVAVADQFTICTCSSHSEWRNQVVYLPR